MRELEVDWGLPTLKRLGARVLATFTTDRRDGAAFHASQAHTPSKTVDCLHWVLPGVPDAWTERLLQMLDGGRETIDGKD